MSKIKFDRREPDTLVHVGDLDVGQMFYDSKTDGFYLALEVDCLCLETFSIISDETFEFVQPVEATITID